MRPLRDRARKGSLLVITLWVITILSVFAIAIGRYLSIEVRLTKYRSAREQARALARSGVFLALEHLKQDAEAASATYEPYDWGQDDWATFVEASAGSSQRIELHITDEDGKLNLGVIDETMQARLRTLLEAAAANAPDLVQQIVDYQDGSDPAESRPDAEPPYVAKDGRILSPEELHDLPGMSPEAYGVLEAHTSPYYAAVTPLNINTAHPEVLSALGLTGATVSAIESVRSANGVFNEGGLGIVETLEDHGTVVGDEDRNVLTTLGVVSQTFRVTSEGMVTLESLAQRPVVRARVEAVIRREHCGSGVPTPCIVAWREG